MLLLLPRALLMRKSTSIVLLLVVLIQLTGALPSLAQSAEDERPAPPPAAEVPERSEPKAAETVAPEKNATQTEPSAFSPKLRRRKAGVGGGTPKKNGRLKGRVSILDKHKGAGGSDEKPNPTDWELVGENSAGIQLWKRKKDGFVKSVKIEPVVKK